MEELTITNNSQESRFQAELGGHLAMLNYQILGGMFQIDYVYVPALYRNRGYGSQLMEAALTFARENGLKVMPVCSYARAYMARDA